MFQIARQSHIPKNKYAAKNILNYLQFGLHNSLKSLGGQRSPVSQKINFGHNSYTSSNKLPYKFQML